MKTNESNVKKARKFMPLCMVMATALFGSCSSDDVDMTVNTDATPVEVTASIEGSELRALTRAGASVQSTAFAKTTSQLAGSKLCIMIDGNDGNYVAKSYDVTNAASKTIALSNGVTAALFPAGVTAVNVYGWFPYNDGSKTFTVNTDQKSDDNYALSDVLFATGATCSRTPSGNSWNVTPAPLTFKHVMSKISLTVTPGADVKIKKVMLKNVNTNTTVSETKTENAVTAFTTGTAATPADITLYENNTGSGSAVACAGVFPPQSVTTSASFVEVTASYGGQDATITYKLSENTEFATGNVYTGAVTVNGGTNVTTGTITLTDWTSGSGLTLNGDKPSL